MRVVFLSFLSPGEGEEERHQRPVTATRTGKVAVWDILLTQRNKPDTRLVKEVDLRAESDQFVLCQDDLFFAVKTSVRRISLLNSQGGSERVYSGEESVSCLAVATVRERTWDVKSFPHLFCPSEVYLGNIKLAEIQNEEEDGPEVKKSKSKKSTEAAKEDEELEEAQADHKPVMKSLIKKGLAPVDPEFQESSSYHVFCEGRNIWDVMLNQTNIQNNNNKVFQP